MAINKSPISPILVTRILGNKRSNTDKNILPFRPKTGCRKEKKRENNKVTTAFFLLLLEKSSTVQEHFKNFSSTSLQIPNPKCYISSCTSPVDMKNFKVANYCVRLSSIYLYIYPYISIYPYIHLYIYPYISVSKYPYFALIFDETFLPINGEN